MRQRMVAALIACSASCKTALLVLSCLVLAFAAPAQTPPNIVLIIGDDHGWPYSGFMGDPHALTPNLDALAAQGVVFRNTHMPASLCAPSLRGLLAGIHSLQWDRARADVDTLLGPGPSIPYREEVEHLRTLPRELQRSGYLSWEGGKMWEGSFSQAGFTHGLATQIPPDCALICSEGDDFGRSGIEPLRDFLDQVDGQPFFAWVAPKLPHVPFDAPAQYRAPYAGQGLSGDQIDYYANVSWLDAVVGEVVAELDARDLRDDTLIVYVSDNGWQIGQFLAGLGKGKGTLYELGFRTPLIFNWPQHVPAGTMRDDLVGAEDIFATLLDYAGAAQLSDRSGASLKPAITTGAPFGRDKVVTYYSGSNGHVGHIVRTPNWRYISFENGSGGILREELYAIATDPYETVDVVAQQSVLLPGFRADVALFEADLNVPPAPLEVNGRLVDPSGHPIAGARVQLTGGTAPVEAVSELDGRFHFGNVWQGSYQLALTGESVNADWFGIGPSVPVQAPVGALAPYVALGIDGYRNPIGVGAHGEDPTVLVDAGTYYLFSSSTGDSELAGNVPLQRSTDLRTWEYLGDALPNLPAWVDAGAPAVRGPATLTRLGRYLLYFSARHRDDGSPQAGRRCIGFAAGDTPTILLDGSASVVPADAPIVCLADGDVFDPVVFSATSPGGVEYAWLLWVERHTGQPDVIRHQLMESDGTDVVAGFPALVILTAQTAGDGWEQGMLASPSLFKDSATGQHFLFYSANDTAAPGRYGANWATCTPTIYGVFAPCQRNERSPWLRSQNEAFRPGDADFFRDASGALWMIYDASAATPLFFGWQYHAPTLRLDPVCLGTDGRPRTTAPTSTPQPLDRDANCALDVQLLAEAWPEADQLFFQDPRWRGGDGAWSIDLGAGRTLWTFGDSFIDPEGVSRIGSVFIRNSIAIQNGADPSTAQMTFHWKTTAGGLPTAYFPNSGANGQIWYWADAGAVVGNKLIIFQNGHSGQSATRTASKAVIVSNYQDDPSAWVVDWYDVPPDPSGHIWDARYAFVDGTNLYVYVTRPKEATGAAYPSAALLRYPNTQAKNGNFSNPRWWTGTQYAINGSPAALWNTSAQYSVHARPDGQHLAIMAGFFYGPGAFATAPDRDGPFSPFTTFYSPPETAWGGAAGDVTTYVSTYLWHAHPQMSGAPVVATYSTHGVLVFTSDESPYYPKFVRFAPP